MARIKWDRGYFGADLVGPSAVFIDEPIRSYATEFYRETLHQLCRISQEVIMQGGADNPNNVPRYGKAFTPGLGPRVEKLEQELADLKEVMAEVLERLRGLEDGNRQD